MSQRSKFQTWLYATRPHTWGASLAPMMIACGGLVHEGIFRFWTYLLCLIVALSAQIASNLANDYFDYTGGKDTDKRVGFERVLTTGEVSLHQMKVALLITLCICIAAGLGVVSLSSWWFLLLGLFVVIGAPAYSAGPYPLSHHGLGDVAVVIFYGLVPVLGTFGAVGGVMPPLYMVLLALGIGMWEANILVVNNYRDYSEDKANNKNTLIVLIGEAFGPKLYLINSLAALLLTMVGLWSTHNYIWICISAIVFGAVVTIGNLRIRKHRGKELNQDLRFTSGMSILIAHAVMFTLLFC